MVTTRRRTRATASQSSSQQSLTSTKAATKKQSKQLRTEIPDSDEEEDGVIQVIVPPRSASFRMNADKQLQASATQSIADSVGDSESSFHSEDELALPIDTPATSISTTSSFSHVGVLESAAETVASRQKTSRNNNPAQTQHRRSSRLTSTQRTDAMLEVTTVQVASSIPNKLGMRASKPVPTIAPKSKAETTTITTNAVVTSSQRSSTTTVKQETKLEQMSDDEEDSKPLIRSQARFKKPVLSVPDSDDEEEEAPLIRSRDKGKGKAKAEDSEDEVVGRKRTRMSSGFQPKAKKTKVEPDLDLEELEIEDSEDDEDFVIDDESLFEEDWDSDEEVLPKGKSSVRKKTTHSTQQAHAGPSNTNDSDSELSEIDDSYFAWDDNAVQDVLSTITTLTRAGASRSAYIPMSRAERDRAALLTRHKKLNDIWGILDGRDTIKVMQDPQPKGLTLTMLPFQLEGLHWLREQEKSEYKGGILADEMGMGKTIQTIALLMSEPRLKPTLVVAPTVALMQWRSEISKHTGDALSTVVFHGASKSASKKELENADVVMTTYSVLESVFRKENTGFKRKDGVVKEKSILHSIKFARVILDEAHNIKDRTCNTARAAFALKTTYKLCLTGTPLQNRIGEFFSLLRFLEIDPFAYYYCRKCPCQSLHWKFSDKRHCDQCNHRPMEHCCFFNNEFLKPIQQYGNTGLGKTAMQRLQVLLKHIMLRRTKVERADDLCLPPRVVEVRRDYFNEEELDLYDSIYGSSKRKFDTYVAQGVVLNNYANIFTLITRMRQLADHPDLVLRRDRQEGQNTLVCVICDEEAEEAIKSRCHHVFCRMCVSDYISAYDGQGNPECPRCHIDLNIDLTQPSLEAENTDLAKKGSILNRIDMSKWRSSSKIEALVEELLSLRARDASKKAIVFSQFTSMLQLVEWRLHRAGFHTVMLEGSMSPTQRESTINHFMNDITVTVFLVSLKAGGVALNLTEASHVFIMDPWWNPSVEWQSGDRVHRIGQRRPCKITRLVIEDSIESRIVELQEKKANMIGATVNGDQSAMERLTPADMQFLFQN